MKLGVNIDHAATLREARKTSYPDPVVGAMLAEGGGADSIVAHLRADRRHIKERDVFLIRDAVRVPFNLEMSTVKSIVDIALELLPDKATLVPERRQELTTEGGLDLKVNFKKVEKTVLRLKQSGIAVSLFIDPVKAQIDKAVSLGADSVELHTGKYANSKTPAGKKREKERICRWAEYAAEKGLFVAAGHGLDYENVKEIAQIKSIEELNIGHSIIARAVFEGLVPAVEEMKRLVERKS